MIVAVPEAEAAVREIRLRHDWSAARGVPAHITVLFPFAEGSYVEEALAELFKAHARFVPKPRPSHHRQGMPDVRRRDRLGGLLHEYDLAA